jgi:hypothetical protein
VKDTGQIVTGTLSIQRFTRSQRQIFAEGTLVGTLATPGSPAQKVGVTQVSVPLVLPPRQAAAADGVTILATCNILNLVLAPLDLNLLGLVVHLDQVVLDISAESGPGNLLGNLLCAITGLLDGGAALATIAALLNSLLALLG